jgi:hypothetical protein
MGREDHRSLVFFFSARSLLFTSPLEENNSNNNRQKQQNHAQKGTTSYLEMTCSFFCVPRITGDVGTYL